MYPNTTIPDPLDFVLPKWHSDPLFRGSYSNMPTFTVPTISPIPAAKPCIRVPSHLVLVSEQLQWLRTNLKLELWEVSVILEHDKKVTSII